MRVAVGTVAGLLVWAFVLTFLPHLLSIFWDMQPDAYASLFVLSWGASMVGLLVAREVADAISKHDRRFHAFTVTGAGLLLVGSIVASDFGLAVTISAAGALLACIVDWRVSGASYSRRGGQRTGD